MGNPSDRRQSAPSKERPSNREPGTHRNERGKGLDGILECRRPHQASEGPPPPDSHRSLPNEAFLSLYVSIIASILEPSQQSLGFGSSRFRDHVREDVPEGTPGGWDDASRLLSLGSPVPILERRRPPCLEKHSWEHLKDIPKPWYICYQIIIK